MTSPDGRALLGERAAEPRVGLDGGLAFTVDPAGNAEVIEGGCW